MNKCFLRVRNNSMLLLEPSQTFKIDIFGLNKFYVIFRGVKNWLVKS